MNAAVMLAAAGCAALALWVASGPAAGMVRLRVSSAAGGSGRSSGRSNGRSSGLTQGRRRSRRWWSDALGLGAAVVRLSRAPADRRRDTALWRGSVIALCDALGAELRAGHPPEAAFAGAMAVLDPAVGSAVLGDRVTPGHRGSVHGAWRQSDRAQRGRSHGGRMRADQPDGVSLGADVPELLERAAQRPGGEGLRLLAACWRIGAERGGAFASVVDGLAGSLRQEQEQRQEISAQLAGPRATARLLACLPVLGLVMASALGARPLSFLLGTLPGALCLAGGLGLDLAGLLWTRRLAAGVEPGAGPRRSGPPSRSAQRPSR